MKKLLTVALLALVSANALAVTTIPVTLLNPIGSTSGQVIKSTGPSTAPAWANVAATNLAAQAANTVVANVTASSASPTAVALPSCSTANSALKYTSGTGLSCGTTFALTSGNLSQFAATTSAQLAGVISDGTGSGALVFATSPTIGTAVINTPTISGGTINNASVGGTTPNTGSFTTLAASSTVSGTGFSNYLASPPAIGATTPSTGKFTSVALTASAKVLATNTSAQSIANNANVVVTGWTALSNQNSNFVASTGIFTAPRAGFYQVSAGLGFVSAAFTAGQNVAVLVLKNGSVVIQGARVVETSITTPQYAPPVSVLVQCAAGDTISIAAFQNSGAPIALNNGGTVVWMSVSETP